jgi:hypothetical protein
MEPSNFRSATARPLAATQNATRLIVPVVGGLLALFVGWFVSLAPNPLTTTVVLAAVVMFSIALWNPVAGLYLLILTSGYLDLVKRLGVLSDALSAIDVVVTLAVAPLLFVCVCVGVLYRCIMSRIWLKWWQVALAGIIVIAMAGVFVQEFFRGGGFLEALKNFANSGAYLPLIVVVCFLTPEPARIQRLLTFCLWFYVPVALYGIWQQFFGLTQFEIDYLKSGFTIDINLLDDARLRPFSTLNSPHALGVVMAMLAIVAAFVPLKHEKRARWQIPLSLIFSAACLATFVRASWAILLLGVVVWVCCRTRFSTIAMYGVAIAGLASLLINADLVLNSLDLADKYLPQGGDVEEQAFRVGTFSERLYSFRNDLTNPEFHTWFGNPSQVYEDLEEASHENIAHEQIGQILARTGFVGLGFCLSVAVLGLFLAHRAVFRQQDPNRRRMMLGILAALIAALLSGMFFGSHLGVFPVNIFFALLLGCFCAIGTQRRAVIADSQ